MPNNYEGPKNEIKGTIKITWNDKLGRLAKAVGLTILLTIVIRFAPIMFCGSFLGGTVFCFQPVSPIIQNGAGSPTYDGGGPSFPDRGKGASANILDCTQSGPSPFQSDQMKISVDSVSIERNGVDTVRLRLNMAIENLTRLPLVLQLYANTRILKSGLGEIVGGTQQDMSNWGDEIEPHQTVNWTIGIDKIPLETQWIDLEFLSLKINDEWKQEKTMITGIRSSC